MKFCCSNFFSRTPIINHGSGPPSGLPLLTHDKKTAESTALAVIADAGSEYPFDSGLYLFPDEPNLDYDIVEDFKNKSKTVIPATTGETPYAIEKNRVKPVGFVKQNYNFQKYASLLKNWRSENMVNQGKIFSVFVH
jgi:hypothetical protein